MELAAAVAAAAAAAAAAALRAVVRAAAGRALRQGCCAPASGARLTTAAQKERSSLASLPQDASGLRSDRDKVQHRTAQNDTGRPGNGDWSRHIFAAYSVFRDVVYMDTSRHDIGSLLNGVRELDDNEDVNKL